MTSTISKRVLDWAFIAAKSLLLGYAAFLLLSCYACADAPEQPVSVRTRIVTPPIPALEPPKPPAPTEVDDGKREKKEAPYYGSTYWDELLTSVYYYPDALDQLEPPTFKSNEFGLTVPATHLKFNHRDDDVWLCGDQRKSFMPGHIYELTVTFEANQPCVTNWKIK